MGGRGRAHWQGKWIYKNSTKLISLSIYQWCHYSVPLFVQFHWLTFIGSSCYNTIPCFSCNRSNVHRWWKRGGFVVSVLRCIVSVSGKKGLINIVLINLIFLSSFEPGAYEFKISKNWIKINRAGREVTASQKLIFRNYGIGWLIHKEQEKNIHLLNISPLVQIGGEI